MTFEDTLYSIVKRYNTLLRKNGLSNEAALELLQPLQAKGFQIRADGLVAYFPAPGLAAYSGLSTDMGNLGHTYEQKSGEALPSAQNGIIRLIFEKSEREGRTARAEKIVSEFSPALKLPKDIEWYDHVGYNKSEYGSLKVVMGEGLLCFMPSGDDSEWSAIEGKLTFDDESIFSIKFQPTVLRKRILTLFFEHIGYNGLERLVE